jgi:hypothetical protein
VFTELGHAQRSPGPPQLIDNVVFIEGHVGASAEFGVQLRRYPAVGSEQRRPRFYGLGPG